VDFVIVSACSFPINLIVLDYDYLDFCITHENAEADTKFHMDEILNYINIVSSFSDNVY